MQLPKIAALVVAYAFLTPLSLAANSEPLEETVVTATRTPEPVDSLMVFWMRRGSKRPEAITVKNSLKFSNPPKSRRFDLSMPNILR